jgi:hypothetical protein
VSTGFTITRIDITNPIGTVSYTPTSGAWTSGEVLITLTTSETITATPSGRTASGTNTYTKTYTANGSETVNFTDVAGNTGSVEVQVDWIVVPTPSVPNAPSTPSYG